MLTSTSQRGRTSSASSWSPPAPQRADAARNTWAVPPRWRRRQRRQWDVHSCAPVVLCSLKAAVFSIIANPSLRCAAARSSYCAMSRAELEVCRAASLLSACSAPLFEPLVHPGCVKQGYKYTTNLHPSYIIDISQLRTEDLEEPCSAAAAAAAAARLAASAAQQCMTPPDLLHVNTGIPSCCQQREDLADAPGASFRGRSPLCGPLRAHRALQRLERTCRVS